MIRIGLSVLALATASTLAACSDDADVATRRSAGDDTAFTPPTVAPAKKAVAIERDDEVLEFEYNWPTEAASVPPLDSWLQEHAETQFATAHQTAAQDKAAMAADGFPFHGHSFEQKWAVVGNTPDTLVMQSTGYEYTGGAHGMPFYAAIIWDKARKKRVATGDMIAMPRLAEVGGKAFCDALDRQRREKRGLQPNANASPDDPFNSCPDLTRQQVFPISRGGDELDVIRVIIAPYEAGPYAEGTYTIDLPMDAAMLTAVKSEYREAFGTG